MAVTILSTTVVKRVGTSSKDVSFLWAKLTKSSRGGENLTFSSQIFSWAIRLAWLPTWFVTNVWGHKSERDQFWFGLGSPRECFVKSRKVGALWAGCECWREHYIQIRESVYTLACFINSVKERSPQTAQSTINSRVYFNNTAPNKSNTAFRRNKITNRERQCYTYKIFYLFVVFLPRVAGFWVGDLATAF